MLKDPQLVKAQWQRFIPKKLPAKVVLPIRIEQPLFLGAEDGRQVFLRVAGSDQQIPQKLIADLKDLSGYLPTAIGILLDADDHGPHARMEWINRKLDQVRSPLRFPGAPGEIVESGGRRCGVFVAPNNSDQGTLEAILMEAAPHFVPSLFQKARCFIESIEEADVPNGDLWRGFVKWNRSKASIHATASVLRPSRPTQATLEDDPWFDPPTSSKVIALHRFLKQLTSNPQDGSSSQVKKA